jgi:glutamate 5-kinase
VVTDLRDAVRHVTPEKGEHSVGGMKAKLEAVGIAVAAGVETVIAHGRKKGSIVRAVAGEDVGTRFPASRKR